MSEKFTFFWSGVFSQWHPSPFQIGDVWYNCAEQYMMAEKARMFDDTNMLQKILNSIMPADQKRFGRMVQNFDLEKWNLDARPIVYRGSYAKYTQNEDMKEELLATVGTTLVEASPEDKIWGIGLRATDSRAQNRSTWQGTNWLGEVLTRVRYDIINDIKEKNNG